MNNIARLVLAPPDGHKKVLLHSCCAPSSGEVIEVMLASGIDYTIFFYNPNIRFEREYLLRKNENVRSPKSTECRSSMPITTRTTGCPRQGHGMGA